MDGFRDRMNRGTSERGSYDRYERTARRSSYGSAAPAGLSAEEVSQIIDDNNAKQLDVITDMFEDAKDDRLESEKQILTAIDDVIAAVAENRAEIAAMAEREPAVPEEEVQAPVYAPQEPVDSPATEEILRTVASNSDLLQQFAEEQLPMLVRGNSSILNQIREDLAEKDEVLREILEKASQQQAPVAYEAPSASSGNEEILSAAANNNALLNALRSEVAAVQTEIRRTSDKLSAKADAENTPLDTDDAFTKTQADEMYKALEEDIHGECVKVYRNVQKVIEDQSVATIEGVKASVGGIKGLTVVNLLLLIVNLAALVLYILQII